MPKTMVHFLKMSHLKRIIFPDPPQVSLRLGRKLDADNIRTGHDVYFECDVRANPTPTRLEWLHNVSRFALKLYKDFSEYL